MYFTPYNFFPPAEITEGTLLRDLIFVFQNIDGQYIQFDSHQDAFRLSSKVSSATPLHHCMSQQALG